MRVRAACERGAGGVQEQGIAGAEAGCAGRVQGVQVGSRRSAGYTHQGGKQGSATRSMHLATQGQHNSSNCWGVGRWDAEPSAVHNTTDTIWLANSSSLLPNLRHKQLMPTAQPAQHCQLAFCRGGQQMRCTDLLEQGGCGHVCTPRRSMPAL